MCFLAEIHHTITLFHNLAIFLQFHYVVSRYFMFSSRIDTYVSDCVSFNTSSNFSISSNNSDSGRGERSRRRGGGCGGESATEEFVKVRTKLFTGDQVHVKVVGEHEMPQRAEESIALGHEVPSLVTIVVGNNQEDA